MKALNNISPLIKRSLKGLPIVIGCILAAVLIARKAVSYVSPTYEAVARIKLDENSTGISNANLFKDFDVFSVNSKIAAEVELLQSKAILQKVAHKLKADHSIFRVGQLRETELGMDRPFELVYQIEGKDWLNRNIELSMEANGQYQLKATINQQLFTESARLGDTLAFSGLSISLQKNNAVTDAGKALDLAGDYRLRLYSAEKQVDRLKSNGLTVTSSDEEVPIIRIACRDASPERAADIANTIADTYIEDHVAFKTQAAGMTLDFIDGQIEEVTQSLQASEAALENYRDEERVINTRQETETNLRKIAEMKIQMANIDMRAAALDTLDDYINSGNKDFQTLAPSFETFGDLLFTELLKKIKAYQAEKIDLLVNYTPESRKVLAIEEKIKETIVYIKESIRNARKDIQVKQKSIEEAIALAEEDFNGLPGRERQMVILDREFQLNQKLYLFLMEKRMESAIQESATMSFHRIIERAAVPDAPVSPKPFFVTVVAAFLGFMVGVGLVLLKEMLSSNLNGPETLQKKSRFPVLESIPRIGQGNGVLENAVGGLAAKLLAQDKEGQLRYISLAAAGQGEGKTFLATALAEALSKMGRRVALVDLNLRQASEGKGLAEAVARETKPKALSQGNGVDFFPAGTSTLHPTAVLNHPHFAAWWKDLSKDYDFVIADTPGSEDAPEALTAMQASDMVLWVMRQGLSKQSVAECPDTLNLQYGIGPFLHVINDVQGSKSLLKRLAGLLKALQGVGDKLAAAGKQKSLEH